MYIPPRGWYSCLPGCPMLPVRVSSGQQPPDSGVRPSPLHVVVYLWSRCRRVTVVTRRDTPVSPARPSPHPRGQRALRCYSAGAGGVRAAPPGGRPRMASAAGQAPQLVFSRGASRLGGRARRRTRRQRGGTRGRLAAPRGGPRPRQARATPRSVRVPAGHGLHPDTPRATCPQRGRRPPLRVAAAAVTAAPSPPRWRRPGRGSRPGSRGRWRRPSR